MGEKGKQEFVIDLKDDVVRGSIVLQDGKMMWPPPKIEVPAPAPPKPKELVKPPEQSPLNAAAWETGLATSMTQYYSAVHNNSLLLTLPLWFKVKGSNCC